MKIKNTTMHRSVRDLSGKRFGKLKVIKFVYSKKLYDKAVGQKRAFFLCKCDCGGKKIVPGILLHNKNTQSCGCIVPPKYPIDEAYFEKVDREDKAYFLGLLITDGTVSYKGAKPGKRIILELEAKTKKRLINLTNFKSLYELYDNIKKV